MEVTRIYPNYLEGATIEDCVADGRIAHGTDFASLFFGGIEMPDVDLSGLDLTLCQFPESNMDGCNFSGSRLDNANFGNTSSCNGANFDDLLGADGFFGNECPFVRTSFRNANLQNADFEFSDLTQADFTGADLRGVNFDSTILTGAIFTDAVTDTNTTFVDAIQDWHEAP